MAAHTPAAEHEAGHPSALGYVKVFFVLLLLTIMEVGALYVPALHPVLPFILIGFSALKFTLVAAFYMHLRFDSRLFTAFFAGGLAIAISIGLALATMFGTWWAVPHAVGH